MAMEKNENQPKGFSEVLNFIKETKDGKFTGEDFSITEHLKFSISHEEIDYIQNENIQTCEIILYGLNWNYLISVYP